MKNLCLAAIVIVFFSIISCSKDSVKPNVVATVEYKINGNQIKVKGDLPDLNTTMKGSLAVKYKKGQVRDSVIYAFTSQSGPNTILQLNIISENLVPGTYQSWNLPSRWVWASYNGRDYSNVTNSSSNITINVINVIDGRIDADF